MDPTSVSTKVTSIMATSSQPSAPTQ